MVDIWKWRAGAASCVTIWFRGSGSDLEAGIILVVVTEGRLEGVLAVAADELPADAVGIAAGVGIDKEAADGVRANGLEEASAVRASAKNVVAAASVAGDRAQNFILLLGVGGREGFHGRKHLFGLCLKSGQAIAIGLLLVLGEGEESTVDEIDDAGFAGAGSFGSGDDARADGFDLEASSGVKNSGLCGLVDFAWPWAWSAAATKAGQFVESHT